MPRTAIGVDIGGTRLRAARVAADGTILALARAASAPDPRTVLERVTALIGEVDDPAVAGIGIGVPGRVDFERRAVLSGGYVDLSTVPLAQAIEERFARPVVIDNDCAMALVAEQACGAAKGARDVVMLTVGTGIGGAIFEGGRMLRSRGTAGQLGHLVVVPDGRRCACGRQGCVETESSGTALGRHIAEAGLPAETTVAVLFEAEQSGDEAAARILQAWAGPLRAAIDSLQAVLDPDLIVLGGGLGEAAAEAVARLPPVSSWYPTRIAAARLGDDAGVVGAALAALPRAPSKRLVMVNGVPASGKSSVALGLSALTGWPVFSLDTVKNPFLEEIESVDRPFNRKLGRASMMAMFALLREAPAGATVIMDAWFGFQPRAFVLPLMAASGATAIHEIWCEARPETVGARYRARAASRLPGHPGPDYAEELVALAQRAEPFRAGPLLTVSTEGPVDLHAVKAWLDVHMGHARSFARFDAA
ncbi:MAG: ROK family protein [Parafilimonas terrae]|nr:ROK family protein [Parafilimonas terrae]